MVSAREAVGGIGNVIAVILFLSPVPTFIQIASRGSVEQFPPWPYLASFVNCGLWVLYAMVHEHSGLVFTINVIGLVIEIVYLALFLKYSDSKQRCTVLLIFVGELVFLGVLAFIVLTMAHTTTLESFISYTASFSNIMMYGAPLSVMRDVIRTKSVEFMPFSVSLLSLFNGISWTIYGVIPVDDKGQDWYIVIPNGIGAFLGLVQVVLYGVFSNRQMPPQMTDEGEEVIQPCLSGEDETERVTES